MTQEETGVRKEGERERARRGAQHSTAPKIKGHQLMMIHAARGHRTASSASVALGAEDVAGIIHDPLAPVARIEGDGIPGSPAPPPSLAPAAQIQGPAHLNPRLDHEALMRVRTDRLRPGRFGRLREVDAASTPANLPGPEAILQDQRARPGARGMVQRFRPPGSSAPATLRLRLHPDAGQGVLGVRLVQGVLGIRLVVVVIALDWGLHHLGALELRRGLTPPAGESLAWKELDGWAWGGLVTCPQLPHGHGTVTLHPTGVGIPQARALGELSRVSTPQREDGRRGDQGSQHLEGRGWRSLE